MFLMVILLKSNTLKFHVKLKFLFIGLPKRNGYGYIDATIQQLLHLAITIALVKAEEICFLVICYYARRNYTLCD